MEPTVFIVEDNPHVAEWLALAAAAQGFRAEVFATGGDFLARADRSQPGCVVLDVHLPDMSGLDVQAALAAEGCLLPLIVVTGAADIPLCVKAMQLGAMHFFEKPLDPLALSDTLRQAVERNAEARRKAGEHHSLLYRLDPAERVLFGHIAGGLSNKAIAKQMDLSVRTIQTRISRLTEKLGVLSRLELVKLGSELFRSTPPPPHFSLDPGSPQAETETTTADVTGEAELPETPPET